VCVCPQPSWSLAVLTARRCHRRSPCRDAQQLLCRPAREVYMSGEVHVGSVRLLLRVVSSRRRSSRFVDRCRRIVRERANWSERIACAVHRVDAVQLPHDADKDVRRLVVRIGRATLPIREGVELPVHLMRHGAFVLDVLLWCSCFRRRDDETSSREGTREFELHHVSHLQSAAKRGWFIFSPS
jgi:hypothetical protein